MRYEWDESKNLLNQRKHAGVSFELAALVFEDECVWSVWSALMAELANNGGMRSVQFRWSNRSLLCCL